MAAAAGGKNGCANIETEGGGDDFVDIVDSPYGQEHAKLNVGDGENVDAEEEEFTIEGGSGSAEDASFDRSVGALQEIVLDDSFQAVLQGFCKENCHHFEDSEENKLIYTDLFKKYSDLIEGTLEKQLTAAVPGFSMEAFLQELAKRGEDEIDPAVFDLLLSLGDFDSFKQQMLSEKAAAKSGGLQVCGTHAKVHQDEDEDGEERPDLEDLLTVMPASPSSAAKR